MKVDQLTVESISEFLSHTSGTDVNKSYELLKMIRNSSTRGEDALKMIFELSEVIDSDNSSQVKDYIDKESAERLFSKYNHYVNSYLRLLVDSGISENEFYKRLWTFINEDSLLNTDEAKAIAISIVWGDYCIPYYEFDCSGKMEMDEFNAICKSIALELSKVRLVVFKNYDLRTEKAAALLSVLDELKDEKKKQVMLAVILSLSEQRVLREDIN